MGIADLTPLLKKHVACCFVDIPGIKLNNRRIAFDGLNWLFTVMGISVKNTIKDMKDPYGDIDPDFVFREILHFFLTVNIRLLSYKITPVWIWDSDTFTPPAKTDTRAKRKENRIKRISKYNNLKSALLSMGVLERPSELFKEYLKLKAETFYFPKSKTTELKEVSQMIGLPTITAPGEGEYLASCLAIERLVACVYSADTDTIALGTPFVTKCIELRNNEMYIKGIFSPTILKTFGFTYLQFRELCFLLGCDFNKRIKGIGPVKSLSMMKEHKNIESVIAYLNANDYDTSVLNLNICRRLLTPSPTGYTDKTELLNMRTAMYTSELDKYNLRTLFNLFFSRSSRIGTPSNVPKTDNTYK